MTVRKLHPDWPETEVDGDRWSVEGPAGELTYALDPSEANFATAAAPPTTCPGFDLADVGQVVRYHVDSNEGLWAPGRDIGTELEMYLVLKLTDGRWAAVEASTDYTGWGCQSGADVRIGDTEQQVVEYGLTRSGRDALGYEAQS